MKKSSNPGESTSQPSEGSQSVPGSHALDRSASPPPRDERFLSRWSRLKRAQSQDAGKTAVLTVPAAPASTVSDAAADTAAANAGMPALPSIDSLTTDSDYAQFLQPKVPESLRRAAMKKLFADPHFNKMDGLDTYIDDYTQFEPIPDALMKTLVQARDIIDHPSNRKVEEAGGVAEEGVDTAAVPVADEVARAEAGVESASDGSAAGIEDLSSADDADAASRMQPHSIPTPGTTA